MRTSLHFPKICQDFLKDLHERQKEVISRRFGLQSGQRESLEAIGKTLSITRERVRQIEADSFSKIRPKVEKYEKVFEDLLKYFKTHGELKREDILFSQISGLRFQPHLYFLLALHPQFFRFPQSQEFYPLWTINQNSLSFAKKVNALLISKLKEKRSPLPFSEIFALYKKNQLSRKINLSSQQLLSFVEISREIEQGLDNLFGLIFWPEINPKGIKDKAFLVLKIKGNPLHFTEITSLIPQLPFEKEILKKKVVPQTVHNELIKDPRFVLVGRGMYALREWGYTPGVVRDVIERVLKERKRPMAKEEIVRAALNQRIVKESTILLNLQNKEYFLKNSEGKYMLRKI